MFTTSALASAVTVLPKNVQALRCALYVPGGPTQLTGLQFISNIFSNNLKFNSNTHNDQLIGVVDKMTRFTHQSLSQACMDLGLPLHMNSMPEGAILSSNHIVATIESTDERWPWLPLLVSDYVDHLETISNLSYMFYGFKCLMSKYIEESVVPESVEEERQFKLRSDIEPVRVGERDVISNAIYHHYPIPLSVEPSLKSHVHRGIPNGDEWEPWRDPGRHKYKHRKIVTFSNRSLDKAGYKANDVVGFFNDRFSEISTAPCIEYADGFFSEEIPTIVKIAKEVSKSLGRTTYVKLEGKPNLRRYHECSPVTGNTRTVLSSMSMGHVPKFLDEWFSSFAPGDYTVNSKGFKIAPVKLLWPFSGRIPIYDTIITKLRVKRLSIENIDFYIPTNTDKLTHRDKMPTYDYFPVAWKVDGVWKALGKEPASPALMYDMNRARHFTADPNEILQADKIDILDEFRSYPNMRVTDSIKDFVQAEEAGGGPLTVPETTDPLLMQGKAYV